MYSFVSHPSWSRQHVSNSMLTLKVHVTFWVLTYRTYWITTGKAALFLVQVLYKHHPSLILEPNRCFRSAAFKFFQNVGILFVTESSSGWHTGPAADSGTSGQGSKVCHFSSPVELGDVYHTFVNMTNFSQPVRYCRVFLETRFCEINNIFCLYCK